MQPPAAAELARLIRVARAHEPADLLFTGAHVLNVYSGELRPGVVAVAEGRIAYVGASERLELHAREVVDVAGKVLVPGYVEPHCHPYVVYNVFEYARSVLARGTTTVVADQMCLFQVLDQTGFEALLSDLARLPLRFLWGIRLATERVLPDGSVDTFPVDRIERSLGLPGVVQTAEMTSWPALLSGRDELVQGVASARARGLRVDGHAAGCGYDTLAALSAAGVSACHEAITAEEALNRVRVGMHAMLRYQSLRPDLPELLRGLKEATVATSRLMLTTDGSSPAYYADGYSDRLVRIALEEDVLVPLAYQMATMNPAVYLGLDADIGGLAPGRLADLLVLDDVRQPTPRQVYVGGRLVAEDGQIVEELPVPRWGSYGFQSPVVPSGWRLAPELVRARHPGGEFPVMKLDGPAVSRHRAVSLLSQDGRLRLRSDEQLLYAALVDRRGRSISQGVVEGFAAELAGFASSFTASLDVLAIGSDPVQVARAVDEVFAMGGGIVLVERGQVRYSLPLPLGGVMSDLPMPRLIERIVELQTLLAERGHPYHDPIYTLIFLTSDTIPDLRLTPSGIFAVKTRQILREPEPLLVE